MKPADCRGPGPLYVRGQLGIVLFEACGEIQAAAADSPNPEVSEIRFVSLLRATLGDRPGCRRVARTPPDRGTKPICSSGQLGLSEWCAGADGRGAARSGAGMPVQDRSISAWNGKRRDCHRRPKIDQTGEGRKIGIPCGSNPETWTIRTVPRWLVSYS